MIEHSRDVSLITARYTGGRGQPVPGSSVVLFQQHSAAEVKPNCSSWLCWETVASQPLANLFDPGLLQRPPNVCVRLGGHGHLPQRVFLQPPLVMCSAGAQCPPPPTHAHLKAQVSRSKQALFATTPPAPCVFMKQSLISIFSLAQHFYHSNRGGGCYHSSSWCSGCPRQQSGGSWNGEDGARHPSLRRQSDALVHHNSPKPLQNPWASFLPATEWVQPLLLDQECNCWWPNQWRRPGRNEPLWCHPRGGRVGKTSKEKAKKKDQIKDHALCLFC